MSKSLPQRNESEPDWADEVGCVDDYPEHDYKLADERDGVRVLRCRRCDAEIWEEDGE